MGTEMATLKLDDSVVRSILEKQIQTAIISQLGNGEELIGSAVSKALSEKCDSGGKQSRYSSDNKYDFLEVLAVKSIREAATKALQTWLEGNAEKIKLAVLKELKKPSRQRSIAVAYANQIEKSLECHWRMNCDIKFNNIEDK